MERLYSICKGIPNNEILRQLKEESDFLTLHRPSSHEQVSTYHHNPTSTALKIQATFTVNGWEVYSLDAFGSDEEIINLKEHIRQKESKLTQVASSNQR